MTLLFHFCKVPSLLFERQWRGGGIKYACGRAELLPPCVDAARAMEDNDSFHLKVGASWRRSTSGNEILLEMLNHDVLNL